MEATLQVRSRRLAMNHSTRRLKPGNWSISRGSMVSTANSGISPTADRTFIGTSLPSGMCITS